ncbi:CLUMA_CG013803, isoform A [Clunio marinus]|uniref:CLUMA_CG013803, isoform A n=1 Tax=Clunio marinus TaxID=568069 RepID=A0A1J1IN69_9DIPT|nr:CLUMA_CG013803, isoform A [Clunio marinus]
MKLNQKNKFRILSLIVIESYMIKISCNHSQQ